MENRVLVSDSSKADKMAVSVSGADNNKAVFHRQNRFVQNLHNKDNSRGKPPWFFYSVYYIPFFLDSVSTSFFSGFWLILKDFFKKNHMKNV